MRFVRPAVVLFDLDDTIIDHTGGVDAAWRTALGEMLDPTEQTRARDAIRERSRWYWSDPERHRIGRADLRTVTVSLVHEALAQIGREDRDLSRRIALRYRDLREESYALLPGAVETLHAFRADGVRLGLVTNGSAEEQRSKLARFDLAGFFDYVCIEGEFGCGKPDVRIYAHVVRMLEADPATTWMVGDNLEWDVAAPMRVGLAGVWVDRHGRGLPPEAVVRPSLTVRSIAELCATLPLGTCTHEE